MTVMGELKKHARWAIKSFLAFLAGAFMFIGLWQVEVMWNQKAWEFEKFSLPFGIQVPWWFARDLWYGCIIACPVLIILAFTPLVVLIKRKIREKMKKTGSPELKK